MFQSKLLGSICLQINELLIFLTSDVHIEQQTGGVKLSVIKIANNGDLKDYIFAYENNILYPDEFNYHPDHRVKTESIGNYQFKPFFKHFSNLDKNKIPVGTELFVEYLMKKPILRYKYSKIHKMVLIGYSKSTYVEKFGKLKTSPSGFNTDQRDFYADEMKINTPMKLFYGVLGTEKQFNEGIISHELGKEFGAVKRSITWSVPEIVLDDLR